ncbi:hypothetical protein Droror1_Dr00020379 [Drosera rotundifolia]
MHIYKINTTCQLGTVVLFRKKNEIKSRRCFEREKSLQEKVLGRFKFAQNKEEKNHGEVPGLMRWPALATRLEVPSKERFQLPGAQLLGVQVPGVQVLGMYNSPAKGRMAGWRGYVLDGGGASEMSD